MNESSTYVGMDCSDRCHRMVVVGSDGAELRRMTVRNRYADVQASLRDFPGSLVALETGTHSRWLQRALEEAGHRVMVANARKLPAITRSAEKTDWRWSKAIARRAA